MFDSAILDVAIGLAFVFLLVSLLVSAVCEMLAAWLKWRSTNLWVGLEHLLQSAEARNQVYNHPLVKGLSKVGAKGAQWDAGRNGPSYIPSRTFALVLIDVLRKPHRFADDVLGRLQLVVTEAANDPAKIFKSLDELTTNVSGEAVPDTVKQQLAELKARVDPALTPEIAAQLKQRVLSLLSDEERARVGEELSRRLDEHTVGAKTSRQLLDGLGNAIRQLETAGMEVATADLRARLEAALRQHNAESSAAAIREIETFTKGAATRWVEEAEASMQSTVEALRPLVHAAGDNVDLFRENIEIWFNDGMDRVSGWYKRHVAIAQAVIALGLAIVMNIDALQITRTLWREPTIRESVVAQATRFADNPSPALTPPASETTGTEAGGKKLSARMSSTILSPGDVGTAYLTLADVATDQMPLVVEPGSPNLLFGEALEKVDSARLEMKLKAGAKEVPIFVRAGPVSAQSLERFKVTAAGLEVSLQVVVRPSASQEFERVQQDVGTLGLPIGWTCPVAVAEATTVGGPIWCSEKPAQWDWRFWLGRIATLATMLFGWLITAAATSLGAPFWFDMLKKVVSVRSSGKAPEERPVSPKEVSRPTEPGQRPATADLLDALKRR